MSRRRESRSPAWATQTAWRSRSVRIESPGRHVPCDGLKLQMLPSPKLVCLGPIEIPTSHQAQDMKGRFASSTPPLGSRGRQVSTRASSGSPWIGWFRVRSQTTGGATRTRMAGFTASTHSNRCARRSVRPGRRRRRASDLPRRHLRRRTLPLVRLGIAWSRLRRGRHIESPCPRDLRDTGS